MPCETNLYGNSEECIVYTKSPNTYNGLWSSSWGLYNTIRAISALNVNTLQLSDKNGYWNWNNFNGITLNAFTATQFLNKGLTSYAQGITGNSQYLSDWYLPSHDEMAFIVSKIAQQNKDCPALNYVLENVGDPILGTYWTSTGAFNYNTKEGGWTGGDKPKPGSVAIVFDVDNEPNNCKVYKRHRENKYKIRPIRMLRCDESKPISNKIWNVPTIEYFKNI